MVQNCAPMGASSDISFRVHKSNQPITNFGSVSLIGNNDIKPNNLTPFPLEYTGAKSKLYMQFGDAANVTRSMLNLDGIIVSPRSYIGAGKTDIGQEAKRLLGVAPIYVKAVIYNLDHGAFADYWTFDDWIYASGDIDGTLIVQRIPISSMLRNNDFTDLYTAVEFIEPLRLDAFRSLLFPIPANYETSMALTIVPSIAINRY